MPRPAADETAARALRPRVRPGKITLIEDSKVGQLLTPPKLMLVLSGLATFAERAGLARDPLTWLAPETITRYLVICTAVAGEPVPVSVAFGAGCVALVAPRLRAQSSVGGHRGWPVGAEQLRTRVPGRSHVLVRSWALGGTISCDLASAAPHEGREGRCAGDRRDAKPLSRAETLSKDEETEHGSRSRLQADEHAENVGRDPAQRL